MQTNRSPISSRHARRRRSRSHPAQVRALRLLHRHLPDLPAARRRARRAARPHLPDQAGARGHAGHAQHAAAPGPLPDLPQLRDHLPVGRAVRPPGRDRPLAAGYELSPVADAHLCCGSAGTYSFTQPKLSKQLRDKKLATLEATSPALIVTANIGCQTHLQSGTATPVRHWIELIDERLAE
jgi:hypothetical protein